MKKKVIAIACCTAALILTSCGNKEKKAECKHTTFEAIAPDATNGDEYLYKITYEDYDFDAAEAISEERFSLLNNKPAGCTSVRNGNLVGRNLDYYVDGLADIVLHMKGKEGRFESIGMATCMPFATKEAIDNGTICEELFKVIPYSMTDGINENGVVINVNVVPTKECEPTTGTNPNAPTLITTGVVRYVLDNAKSVDDAITLIKSRNLIAPPTEKFPFETHWMISDSTKTVVVEIWNNEVIVSDSNIMTNFYVCHPEALYGQGIERFGIMKENYDLGSTKEGMLELMKKVWYSKAYSTKTDPFWYSEYFDRNTELSIKDVQEGNLAKFDSIKNEAENRYQNIDYQKANRFGKDWYTTHTTIYDIDNLSFTINAQENDTQREFKLK